VRRHYPGDDVTLSRDSSDGGLVYRSLKGVWHRLISILDFASLYPSIIMSDDVDYSTLVWEERHMNLPGYTYRRIAH
jgi:DNA polymerase delta subunit 1